MAGVYVRGRAREEDCTRGDERFRRDAQFDASRSWRFLDNGCSVFDYFFL